MPVSSVTNRIEYQGNGTSAVFSFQYPLHAQGDLSVFAFNSSRVPAEMITALVLNGSGAIGYTLQGNTDLCGIYQNGVSVIFNSTPSVHTQVVLFRSSVVTNSFFVGRTGAIPSTGLNNEIDYLTLLAQRHQDQITRSIRLPDGMAGAFDTTLPPNIKSSPGNFIVINSSGLGFGLTDSLGGSYIPNTVIVAATATAVASLGGAAAGTVLVSNGSSAPTWQTISISSGSGVTDAANITGILAVEHGGTGTGTSYTQYGVLFASSATQFANTPAGGLNLPLLGAGASAPTFGPLPLASGIVSGALAVVNGGTGVNSLLPQFGLLYASSATQVAVVPSAAAGLILTANGSSVPTFQAAPAPNLTVGSGVLPIANGGTNTGTMVSGSILFGSSTTQVGKAVVGINQVVLGGGSSAPSNVSGYGSSGLHVLTSGGDGAAPAWQAFTASVTAASQAQMEAASSVVVAATPGNMQYHPGVAKVYARVSIVGSTVPSVAASSSFNVSSVTDIDVGLMRLNFTTPFSSANYCPTVCPDHQPGVRAVMVQVLSGSSVPTTSALFVATTNNAFAFQDSFGFIGVAIYGDQ